MTEPVKINSLDVENVKRVKTVALTPTKEGLTVIGGKNGQGKTSVIDAIAWALGGDRMRPDVPKREGAAGDPYMKVELSNGVVVERKGPKSNLKVIDPEGNKAGQQLLNAFVSAFALDLPRFMGGSDKEKADALLQIIGVGDQLAELDRSADDLYNKRLAVGQMERQKRGAANEMQHYPDAPGAPISASELIQEQQAILARNGENQKLRQKVEEIAQSCEGVNDSLAAMGAQRDTIKRQLADIDAKISEAKERRGNLEADLVIARKTAEQLQDESTEEVEEKLKEIDAINEKVRTNQAKDAATEEADALLEEYEDLSRQLESVRSRRMALLKDADLPLAELSIDHGCLTYKGAHWNDMSGSEQLKVATAIVRRLNPSCGFVLVDKLEQMDMDTLRDFGAWAEGEDLQIIGTRVSSGDECSVIIEDGLAESAPEAEKPAQEWVM